MYVMMGGCMYDCGYLCINVSIYRAYLDTLCGLFKLFLSSIALHWKNLELMVYSYKWTFLCIWNRYMYIHVIIYIYIYICSYVHI